MGQEEEEHSFPDHLGITCVFSKEKKNDEKGKEKKKRFLVKKKECCSLNTNLVPLNPASEDENVPAADTWEGSACPPCPVPLLSGIEAGCSPVPTGRSLHFLGHFSLSASRFGCSRLYREAFLSPQKCLPREYEIIPSLSLVTFDRQRPMKALINTF